MNYLDKIYTAIAYAKHFTKSKNVAKLDNPYLLDLYNKVINNAEKIEGSEFLEEIRNNLLFKKSFIDVIDFGAMANKRSDKRRIKDITAQSISDKRKCHFFYHLIKFINPQIVIELGTSFGINTMYMSMAAPQAKVYTIEGCSQTMAIAKTNFEDHNFNNIFTTNATFDVALPDILNKIEKLDFIFFDGNHLKEPTLRYFEMSLPYAHNDTILVFDDIHWSPEMNSAWNTIRKNKQLTVTIDLFYFGIVFFKNELPKQHLTLRY